jgi:hypothetical protein
MCSRVLLSGLLGCVDVFDHLQNIPNKLEGRMQEDTPLKNTMREPPNQWEDLEVTPSLVVKPIEDN